MDLLLGDPKFDQFIAKLKSTQPDSRQWADSRQWETLEPRPASQLLGIYDPDYTGPSTEGKVFRYLDRYRLNPLCRAIPSWDGLQLAGGATSTEAGGDAGAFLTPNHRGAILYRRRGWTRGPNEEIVRRVAGPCHAVDEMEVFALRSEGNLRVVALMFVETPPSQR